MPATRTIKGGYTSNISNSGSSTSALPSSSQSDPSMSDQPPLSPNTAWESTTESPNESLPPRIRLKKKREPFTEFRIIREPGPLQDHTTELKPIPNPPWANNDSNTGSPEDSSHHDDTRGTGKGTLGPQDNCTYGRKSSAECSAQTAHDEDEDDMAVAPAVLKKQLHRSGTEANTFPPPARPSRKQKRYACDVCGQIFTRSGDVRRHKESRHDNSEGCRCPFCDRVLTRQDALQRHWDKYCRKKSKRHLDKQAAETQLRTTIPSTPTPLYAPASPPQTTSITTTTTNVGIGTGLDQSQVNYRYLNIFG